MDEKLLRVPEVSLIMGVHVMTVYLLVRRGELKAIRIGKRSIRVPESEIRRWIEEKQLVVDTRQSRFTSNDTCPKS
ncbi:MAG: helix-turn-helix domain-containing protein [Syntrophorhabdales bacterium]|jgi:excisionase family DNA binding protein